jgi:hypothetical protein
VRFTPQFLRALHLELFSKPSIEQLFTSSSNLMVSQKVHLRRCNLRKGVYTLPPLPVFARLASGAFFETIALVKTRVQDIYNHLRIVDSGFRRNDEEG